MTEAADGSTGQAEKGARGEPVEEPTPAISAESPTSEADASAEETRASSDHLGLGGKVTGTGKRVIRIRRKRGPVELTFQPVENGIDYLLSVTEHLADNPSPRDLKYAVLHLQAATEVLLKSRLQLEHWALVFERPEKASREDFEKADFPSCGTTDALKRLKDIAGIDLGVSGSIDNNLNKLVKWRNALQHYGLTVPAPAVEKLAANVLDFLLVFVRDQLRPALEPRERHALDREMESVSEGLAAIKRFLTTRWSRLSEELKPLLDETVCCPLCMQNALLVDGEPDCRFCQMVWRDGGDAAAAYVENVQRHSIYEQIAGGGDALVTSCPDCEYEALVADVEMASGRTIEYFCFQCGTQHGPMSSCDSCGTPAVEDDGLSLCGSCLESKPERF
ncbi:hypothetical protein ACFVYF_23485 [Streptomyces sp. NPDC058274]|uniref:hypothetical protein n=1 Tax=Streptomyces sp. NPDC058274 TaxID=3346416 RepID=UPI0036EBF17F